MTDTSFSYSQVEATLKGADAIYEAKLHPLNNSGVDATALLAVTGHTLSIAVLADGLTPGEVHVQHIHGTFDANGNPTDAMTPTFAQDADHDGYVEVGEGATVYGDILLPIEDHSNGLSNDPVADRDGSERFFHSFDLTNDSLFLNPLSGKQYTGAAVMPLTDREVVIHGLALPAGPGAGTTGAVDGTAGYKLTLPVAAGDIATSTLADAMHALAGAETKDADHTILHFYDLLGRSANGAGLDYWDMQAAHGTSLAAIGDAFAGSAEFHADYGAQVSDQAYVDLLYQHVLGRAADTAGESFWVAGLAGGESRGELLAAFATSDEAHHATTGMMMG